MRATAYALTRAALGGISFPYHPKSPPYQFHSIPTALTLHYHCRKTAIALPPPNVKHVREALDLPAKLRVG